MSAIEKVVINYCGKDTHFTSLQFREQEIRFFISNPEILERIRGSLQNELGLLNFWPVNLGGAEHVEKTLRLLSKNSGPNFKYSRDEIDNWNLQEWMEENLNRWFRSAHLDQLSKGRFGRTTENISEAQSFEDTIKQVAAFENTYIALLPVSNWSAVFELLNFGSFNACPEWYVHKKITEYWNRKFGLSLQSLTHDSLTFSIKNPPKTKDQCMELALEHLVYCPDQEPADSLEEYATWIQDKPYWKFWWD